MNTLFPNIFNKLRKTYFCILQKDLRGDLRIRSARRSAEKGVSIYLAIAIMFIILGIGLALSTILVGQIRIIRGMGNSVVAIYAADTGIEWALYQDRKVCSQSGCPSSPCKADCSGLDVGTYHGFFNIDGDGTIPSGNCPADLTIDPDDACYRVIKNATIESVGFYKGVRRAIEISF